MFSEAEIVAVRTTIDVIRDRAVSDLQFLRNTRINRDSFWLVFLVFFLLLPANRPPRMKLLLPCILLVSVPTLSAAVDFQQVSQPAARSDFMKQPYSPEKAVRIVKRSLPAWLSPAESHRIKRSTEQGESCKALQGADTKLAGNTHRVSYRPRSCYYSAFSRLTTSRKRKSRCTERPDQLFTLLTWWACFSTAWQRRADHCVVF